MKEMELVCGGAWLEGVGLLSELAGGGGGGEEGGRVSYDRSKRRIWRR